MNRFVGTVCLAVLCSVASRVSADVAEDLVMAYLHERGIALGCNSQAGEIVAIGRAHCLPGSPGGDFASLRDKCHKIASLKARSEILQSILVTSSAAREAGLGHDGVAGERTAASACRAFSERRLSGWWVLVSREHVDGAGLSVCVAVAWSPSSERRFCDLKARRLVPAGDWKDELLAYIKGQDLTSWADVRLFVDSAGFPHLMGIGTADWEGHPSFRNAALRRADMLAQKNLLLGLYGDSAVMEAAGKRRRDASSGSATSAELSDFYESLSEVGITMPLPEGCRPIYMTETGVGENGRRKVLSVFSYEPSVVASAGGAGVGKGGRGTAFEASPSGVMIFNPNTGKFEGRAP